MEHAHSVVVSLGSADAAWMDDWRGEAVRCLREAADRIEAGMDVGGHCALLDINGNELGYLSVKR